jgi:hypothetical protein
MTAAKGEVRLVAADEPPITRMVKWLLHAA